MGDTDDHASTPYADGATTAAGAAATAAATTAAPVAVGSSREHDTDERDARGTSHRYIIVPAARSVAIAS